MTILTTLRFAFKTLAALWLALAGVIVPELFAMDDSGATLAAWHVLILSSIALAARVGGIERVSVWRFRKVSNQVSKEVSKT